jgi:hypothetical protein
MRLKSMVFATGAALLAASAHAQVGVNVGTGVGVGVNVPVGSTVDTVGRTVDRTVDRADRTVNRVADSRIAVATSADVTAGATVRDGRGHRVGTVQSVSADGAVVVQGNRRMHVPLSSLYRTADGYVTSLSRSQLRASADARAHAGHE